NRLEIMPLVSRELERHQANEQRDQHPNARWGERRRNTPCGSMLRLTPGPQSNLLQVARDRFELVHERGRGVTLPVGRCIKTMIDMVVDESSFRFVDRLLDCM